MTRLEMEIIGAESEVERLTAGMEKAVALLKEALNDDLTNEGYRNTFIARSEDVRRCVEAVIGAKKLLEKLEGLQ